MCDNCKQIHHLFHFQPIHNFLIDKEKIPQNGIYILFEKGEIGHDVNRIVRVGTHTGNNQLYSRLKQHFIKENKDRSIFRKNIGRAFLNKENNSLLSNWEIDLTTRENKLKYIEKYKVETIKLEKRITNYIQKNFTFVVIPIEEKEKRLDIESKIISTVSLCEECKPSDEWFGNFSPKEKIRKSGLWLVNGLWKKPISSEEIEQLKERVNI